MKPRTLIFVSATFLPKVRIEILLLAGVVSLGFQGGAFAQAIFNLAATPVTAVSDNDHTARAGDIYLTIAPGSLSSTSGTIVIQYPIPITCPASLITVEGTVSLLGVTSSVNYTDHNLTINVPLGGQYPDYIRVSGVRLGIAESSVTGPVNVTLTTTGGNTLFGGYNWVTVISSVGPGIRSLSGIAGEINATTGAVTVSPAWAGAEENHLDAFAALGPGDTTSVMVRLAVDQAPPVGVTVTFPAQAVAGNPYGDSVWQRANPDGTFLDPPSPLDITWDSIAPLNVYYRSTLANPTSPLWLETLSVPVTLTVSDSAPLPLPPMTVSYTVSLTPIGTRWGIYGVGDAITSPIPRFDASEVGPATLFTTTTSPRFSVAPVPPILLDPASATNTYEFAGNLFNYKVIYPPFPDPGQDVYLAVQPILISQTDLEALVDGTSFEGASIVPYGGTGGYGVLFRATCEDSGGTPIPCPAPGGTYEVKTSWEPDQPVVAPAFLKAPQGTRDWEDILTAYYEDRIDPTGRGGTCCRLSDFVFVDRGESTTAGTPLPTITINSPTEVVTYQANSLIVAV